MHLWHFQLHYMTLEFDWIYCFFVVCAFSCHWMLANVCFLSHWNLDVNDITKEYPHRIEYNCYNLQDFWEIKIKIGIVSIEFKCYGVMLSMGNDAVLQVAFTSQNKLAHGEVIWSMHKYLVTAKDASLPFTRLLLWYNSSRPFSGCFIHVIFVKMCRVVIFSMCTDG